MVPVVKKRIINIVPGCALIHINMERNDIRILISHDTYLAPEISLSHEKKPFRTAQNSSIILVCFMPSH